MTAHDVSGAATLEHLRDIARLSGLSRDMYLSEIERTHGVKYRLALAREDVRRRDAEGRPNEPR